MKWIELDQYAWPTGYAVIKEINDKGKEVLTFGEFYENGFLAICYDESTAYEFTPFWKYYYCPVELPI